jgi:hypothetical protein
MSSVEEFERVFAKHTDEIREVFERVFGEEVDRHRGARE